MASASCPMPARPFLPRIVRPLTAAVCATLLALVLLGPLARLPAAPVEPTDEAPAATGWRAVEVTGGLERPWAIAWLPDGSALLTEKAGRLRLLRDGGLAAAPLGGVPAVYAEGQGGLMDVALHPRFAENRLVYLTYSEGTREANRTRLARGRLAADATALENVEVIFTVGQSKNGGQHFGSRLLWLPDGTLLLSIGDGGNPPVKYGDGLIREQAQNLATHFGKVLRLRDDGTPAPDNPFAGRADADLAVWSLGHRNIQGLARDPASGRLWATEHGARGGDELNLLAAGANYGWPRATHGREYTFLSITPHRELPGMADAAVVWVPSKAPSGLAFYTGERFAAWRGDLFSGALRGEAVWRIDLDDTGRVLGQETLELGERVRDVRQGPDGYLYVLTDEAKGRLLRLEPEA
jgi:aldose sugar dehydrogenase